MINLIWYIASPKSSFQVLDVGGDSQDLFHWGEPFGQLAYSLIIMESKASDIQLNIRWKWTHDYIDLNIDQIPSFLVKGSGYQIRFRIEDFVQGRSQVYRLFVEQSCPSNDSFI